MSRKYSYEYPSEPQISYDHGCRRYVDKVCIVTASTLGIGLAIATRLAEEGGSIVISSRKQAQVDIVVSELKAKGLEASGCVCHQSKAEDRKALIDFTLATYGKIDVVVLNAAVQPGAANGPTLSVPDEMFDKIFDVNVKSYWQFCKDVKAHLNPCASFCFVSSNGGYNPTPPLGIYAISKTAILGLTKLLAAELGPEGIRVNCLAPGLIRTRFSEFLWKDDGSGKRTGRALKQVESGAFLRRAGEPVEMGSAVAFMCSDDASYMTGETMLCTGGGAARL